MNEMEERPKDKVCLECGREYHHSTEAWKCVCGSHELVERDPKDEQQNRVVERLKQRLMI